MRLRKQILHHRQPADLPPRPVLLTILAVRAAVAAGAVADEEARASVPLRRPWPVIPLLLLRRRPIPVSPPRRAPQKG